MVLLRAFIEIRVAAGSSDGVLEAIRKVDGVREAYPVTGHCDIITVVEAADLKTLGNIVTKCIHIVKDCTS